MSYWSHVFLQEFFSVTPSLLGNLLTGQGIKRAGKGREINRTGEGIVRAGYGNIEMDC